MVGEEIKDLRLRAKGNLETSNFEYIHFQVANTDYGYSLSKYNVLWAETELTVA